LEQGSSEHVHIDFERLSFSKHENSILLLLKEIYVLPSSTYVTLFGFCIFIMKENSQVVLDYFPLQAQTGRHIGRDG
jgi:hypothetical protein